MENELAKKGKELFLKSKGWEKMSYGAYFKDPDNNFIWDVDHAYLEAIKSELTESELTSLPEKWCIKVTDENKREVNDYFCKKTPFKVLLQGEYFYIDIEYIKTLNHSEFTEITTEQFKKWVLKEDFTINKADFISGREPIKPTIEFVEDPHTESKLQSWIFVRSGSIAECYRNINGDMNDLLRTRKVLPFSVFSNYDLKSQIATLTLFYKIESNVG